MYCSALSCFVLYSTYCLADVMVYEWVGGKHACADLIGVSSHMGLGIKAFTVWHATLKIASSKVAKHEKG